MPLSIPMVTASGIPSRRMQPGDLLGGSENILNGAIATAGDGTWTGAAIATGIIRRTGPGGGYTDTTDTATNILLAIAGSASTPDATQGTTFRMRLINTVAQALTFAAGTGVVAGTGTLNVAASLWRDYIWTIMNASPAVLLSCGTTNASKVVTFVLPVGMTALPIGPAPNAVNITPGMTVNGTGISAATTVASVTQGAGGITGVVLSANATATNNPVALTFGPTLQIDSIGSGTL